MAPTDEEKRLPTGQENMDHEDDHPSSPASEEPEKPAAPVNPMMVSASCEATCSDVERIRDWPRTSDQRN